MLAVSLKASVWVQQVDIFSYISDIDPILTNFHNKTTALRAKYKGLRFSSTLAIFHYLKPLKEYRNVKPFHINVLDGGIPNGVRTNEVSEPYRNLIVHNIKGNKSKFSLDQQEFTVAKVTREDASSVLNAIHGDDYLNMAAQPV